MREKKGYIQCYPGYIPIGTHVPPPADKFLSATRHCAPIMAALIVSLLAASATLELTSSNFDEEVVKSGKSAFVKVTSSSTRSPMPRPPPLPCCYAD